MLGVVVGVAFGLLVSAPATAASPAVTRSPTITWYFGLQRPESAARAAYFAVSDPASPAYRSFFSVREVARRFGARERTRLAFRRAARRHGFSARIDRSGVFARVTGTVARFEDVFQVRIRKEFNNDVFADGYFVAGNRRLRLPRDLAPLVQDVVASFSRSTTIAPASVSRATQAPSGKQPGNRGTWSEGCSAARATGGYAFGQVRHAYGLDRVAAGAGGLVAILNAGEGMTAKDRDVYARCFGLAQLRTRTLLTDGQARPFGRGSFEPQEDLALVRGMAPRLRAVTFAQTWLATELWFLGAADVLAAPRLPDTFSISYGECERDVRGRRAGPASRAGARLMDALLVRLGLAGVGAFASAGDFGSTCNGQPFAGVAWPASSPFVTAVGGTRLTLDNANARAAEVVWNDLRWLSSDAGGGAGGGGLSAASARPPFQSRLTVPGRRRAVPDISAHASMLPGWPINIASNWVEDGGTSASAPLVASAFAVMSARQRAAGRPPLGPVNGLLYNLRWRAPSTLFDITSGANGYDRRVPARHAAPGYDLASGLGVPRFGRLAALLQPSCAARSLRRAAGCRA